MAVRQYIGARYVTKVYENSQDPTSAEWEANINYEPLTMVTYNMGSYLSKKDVPASVGDPATNPTYWVQTGFYNGQISWLDSIKQNKILDTPITVEGSSKTTVEDAFDGIAGHLDNLNEDFSEYVEEIGDVAQGSYIKGALFIASNGHLYKATDEITGGVTTLTVNTNCVITTLADQLDAKSISTGITKLYAYRTGQDVTLYSQVDPISTVNEGWVSIGQLPEELRPELTSDFVAYNSSAHNRSEASAFLVRIKKTDGDISVYLFANESCAPHFTVTYIAQMS